jgi:hypothetical protein
MNSQDLCAWLRSEEAVFEVIYCFDQVTVGFRREFDGQEQIRWALVRYLEEMQACALDSEAVAVALNWLIRKPGIIQALNDFDEFSDWTSLPTRVRVVGEFCARLIERAGNPPQGTG